MWEPKRGLKMVLDTERASIAKRPSHDGKKSKRPLRDSPSCIV